MAGWIGVVVKAPIGPGPSRGNGWAELTAADPLSSCVAQAPYDAAPADLPEPRLRADALRAALADASLQEEPASV